MARFVRVGMVIDNVLIAAGTHDSDLITFATGDKDTSFFIFATQTGSLQIQIDPRDNEANPQWEDLDAPLAYATANKWQSLSLDFKLPGLVRVQFTPNVFPCTASVLAQGSGIR